MSVGCNRVVHVVRLGRTKYLAALVLQRRLHALRRTRACGDMLLLTEHEPVLTLGRRADERFLRVPAASLADHGIELVRTERGGDVTFHGPGQLVAYPILDLRDHGRDVHRYVRCLEETGERLLARYGVEGRRAPGTPGVWVGDDKIASVGVFVSHWISMHGIAINISTALDRFDLIHACGLVGQRMTSLATLQGTAPTMDDAITAYAGCFADVFAVALIEEPESWLRERLAQDPRPVSGPAVD